MKVKSERLAAPRLILKGLAESDREAMLRLFTDEDIRKTYMLPDFRDRGEAEALFERIRKLSVSPDSFVYGIYLEGRLIGMINQCGTDGAGIELGYFIDPGYQGRGYATEALRTAIGELFRMGYERITAGFFMENAASRRVMEKCGMHPLDRQETIRYRDADHVCVYYGIDSIVGNNN